MKRAPKNVVSTPINNSLPLLEEVKRTIQGHALVPYGGRVLVGVSGGPDSTALLHILYNLRHQLGLTIIVAHFNHRLRPDARRDQKFVERLAQGFHLEFVGEQAKHRPPKIGSLEDWARQQRFDFLIRTAHTYKVDAVALAHTADDQAETVLMRVLRGSGLSGLRAMSERRTLGRVEFIRPLLSLTKKQILEYIKKHRLKFCLDQTNIQTDFFRNKIRLKLLPLLKKEYNANITRVLVNLSKTTSEDYEFLTDQAHGVWKRVVTSLNHSQVRLNVAQLNHIHSSLKRMVLRRAFEYLKGDLNQLNFDHILLLEHMMTDSTGGLDLPGNISVKKTKKHLCFSRR